MICADAGGLLPLAPLDSDGDLLAPGEASGLAVHVGGCATCGGRLSAWSSFCEQWSDEVDAGLDAPRPALRERLLASLAAEDARRRETTGAQEVPT